MAGNREKPEDIVSKLRLVEVLQGQGATIAEAVREIGVTHQTFYRCRKLYGGMGRSQLARLKELEKENQRLRRAVSDLILNKLILTEAARGNFQALRVVASALTMCGRNSVYQNAAPAARLVSTGPRSASRRAKTASLPL
jgi:transposase-like protein